MLWAVSRAPLAKLQAYERRMGWTFPWASSFGSDFNADFNLWVSEEQQRKGVEYNYAREKPFAEEDFGEGAARFATMSGTDVATYTRERPGMSAFVRGRCRVSHVLCFCARTRRALGHVSVA